MIGFASGSPRFMSGWCAFACIYLNCKLCWYCLYLVVLFGFGFWREVVTWYACFGCFDWLDLTCYVVCVVIILG